MQQTKQARETSTCPASGRCPRADGLRSHALPGASEGPAPTAPRLHQRLPSLSGRGARAQPVARDMGTQSVRKVRIRMNRFRQKSSQREKTHMQRPPPLRCDRDGDTRPPTCRPAAAPPPRRPAPTCPAELTLGTRGAGELSPGHITNSELDLPGGNTELRFQHKTLNVKH